MEDNNYDKEGFLRELTELSRKYGLYIGGCGCCGSPWVSTRGMPGGEYVLRYPRPGLDVSPHLEWIEPKDKEA